jgi:ABC-2 type transport system ATP-binding protein
MYVIEIHELSKIYTVRGRHRNIVALDGISLDVNEGEVFGLLGPNGAGKTTLVKVLLGITQASGGSALVTGYPPKDPKSRFKVGFLPESHRFPRHLTGAGLLTLAGRLHGLSASAIGERTRYLLKLVGMDKWGDTKVSKYSKGMSQRIGLAQALVADPELLILDEPTDGVDPVGKSEIKSVLRQIASEGKTVFLNSHLLSEVEEVADRVAILSQGKVLRTGAIEDFTVRALRYEIEAEIGNEHIDIPEEVGKKVAITSQNLLVDLKEIDGINKIIDDLRLRKISIRSVKPVKISLEQSFLETLRKGEGGIQ